MMSKIYVYFWIDGDSFDPEKFNNSLTSSLRGSICQRRKSTNGQNSQLVSFWKSKINDLKTDCPEDELVELLKQYETEIMDVIKDDKNRVIAEIVAEYNEPSHVRGYYFSPEAIDFLSKLKVGVDIDVYCEE